MNLVIDGRTIQDHFPGVARYTYNLALALGGMQPDLKLSLVYHPGATNRRYHLHAIATKPGVRLIDTAARPFSLSEQVLLPLQIRRLEPNVSHLPYTIRPYAWPGPVVVTVHDLIPLMFPEGFPTTYRLLFRLAMSLHIHRANQVIAVSSATYRDLIRIFHLSPERIVVIPEAIDLSFQPHPPSEVDALRQRYRLPAEYLLYLGMNKPHKNLVRLVEAYARLGSDVPGLVLAGREDTRYPQARQRVEELGLFGRVLFPGDIDNADLPALYSGATLFVFPSLYEGFGLPPLEAMACGAPVLCSNASSLPEVVGDAALLMDPLDVDSITDSIRQALNDAGLRLALREAGLARAIEFTWERTARETLAVYNRVRMK